jgi:serine/threonine-protein kinase
VVPSTGACVVSYAVQSDAAGKFSANVTVANRADSAVNAWSLWFIMPGDQVLTPDPNGRFSQLGRTVTMKSAEPLGGLGATTVSISGSYTTNNSTPLAFRLNNRSCDGYVSAGPGEPTQKVEQLSDGDVRLTPASSTPVPGVSIDPTGGVHLSPTTAAPSGGTSTTPVIKLTTSPAGEAPKPPPVSSSSATTSTSPSASESVSESPSVVASPSDGGVDCDTTDAGCTDEPTTNASQ